VMSILVYLGEISYSIYMMFVPWQLLFVNLTSKLLHYEKDHMPIYLWLIFLAGLVPLAAAAYHFIERPARDFMRGGLPAPGRPLATVS
jgi:peptidoglycan/LPS O-acetylase OafA/YrhL